MVLNQGLSSSPVTAQHTDIDAFLFYVRSAVRCLFVSKELFGDEPGTL